MSWLAAGAGNAPDLDSPNSRNAEESKGILAIFWRYVRRPSPRLFPLLPPADLSSGPLRSCTIACGYVRSLHAPSIFTYTFVTIYIGPLGVAHIDDATHIKGDEIRSYILELEP